MTINNIVKLNDSVMDALVKLAKGNPGAVRVLSELANKENGLIHILKLDDYGIYGCRIWLCYKDMCGEDIDKLYELLRSNKLKDAIRHKCSEDEMFDKEWHYYAKD